MPMKKRNTKAENALLRMLKTYSGMNSRLFLCDVRGTLWWCTPYMAARVDDDITYLLADYNLKPEPMTCEVDRTIIRIDVEPPNLAGLVPVSVSGWKPIVPMTVGRSPLHFTDQLTGQVSQLWTEDGKRHTFSLSMSLLPIVYAAGGTAMLFDPKGSRGPDGQGGSLVVRVDDDGEVLAVVMPVRAEAADLLDFTDNAKAAA